MKRTVLALLVSGIAGCSVAPTIEYSFIEKPADLRGDEIDSFFLQRSILKIDRNGTKKNAAGTAIDDVVVTSNPSEFNDVRIAMRRADQFGVRTNLNLTKRPNTDLVSEAGVEVVDKRIDLISKIGSIAVKAVPLLFDTGLNPDSLPRTIPVDVLLRVAKVDREKKEGIDVDGVTIDIGPLPPDAEAVEVLRKNRTYTASSMLYSACRSATVRLKLNNNDYIQTVKVSDPRYYQVVAFPVKGKISMHSECGVSVTSDKETGVSSTAAVLEALLTQFKSVKDAVDNAEKDKKDK